MDNGADRPSNGAGAKNVQVIVNIIENRFAIIVFVFVLGTQPSTHNSPATHASSSDDLIVVGLNKSGKLSGGRLRFELGARSDLS